MFNNVLKACNQRKGVLFRAGALFDIAPKLILTFLQVLDESRLTTL